MVVENVWSMEDSVDTIRMFFNKSVKELRMTPDTVSRIQLTLKDTNLNLIKCIDGMDLIKYEDGELKFKVDG